MGRVSTRPEVLQVCDGRTFQPENLITPLVTRLVSRIASCKAVADQARALTVAEVQILEKQLETAKYALDRCYAATLDASFSRCIRDPAVATWSTWPPSTWRPLRFV